MLVISLFEKRNLKKKLKKDPDGDPWSPSFELIFVFFDGKSPFFVENLLFRDLLTVFCLEFVDRVVVFRLIFLSLAVVVAFFLSVLPRSVCVYFFVVDVRCRSSFLFSEFFFSYMFDRS